MIAFYAILSFVPVLLLGFLLVSVLWSKEADAFCDVPVKWALAAGIGFAISSCLVFVWMMVAGRLTRGVLVCELLLIAGLGLLLFQRRRVHIPPQSYQPDNRVAFSQSAPYLLRSAFGLASLLGLIRFCWITWQYPHGEYDAFSIWNLRARFLYRGAQHWRAFTHATADSHTDYPLLLPASVARSWEFIGSETQLVPSIIALLFTFATVGLVAASVSRLRGERQGLLAGLVLLGTPFLILHGASQYADVPLGFFFVATVVFLFLYAQSPSNQNFLILAGIAAASSAWTKNEGILFLVLLFALHAVITVKTKGRKQWGSEFVALMTGAAPIGAVILIYKFFVAARNDLVAAQSIASMVPKLSDISRYHLVLHWFLSSPFSFGRWSGLFAMPALLVFYFLLLGAGVKKHDVCAANIAASLAVFMGVGYFFVYVLSPADLAWHLGSSLDRLLLQLWPAVVFTYFMVVQTPEEALMTQRVRTAPA
jgi:Dolichyl-phosphate-mannose-protein mannosyltransferase